MRFNRVLFTDDFLRSRATGAVSHPNNRRMMRGLFAPALARLGVPYAEVFSEDDGGDIPTASLIAAVRARPHGNIKLDLGDWAAATAGEIPLDAAHALRLDVFEPDALVIGFGLPPSILNLLDRRGCSFIDAEIHPVRFTRELALRVRTNDPLILPHLDSATQSDGECWAAAAALSAYYARRAPPFVIDASMRVGVFVGQMQIDFSLVQDGALLSPVDRLAEISALARSVDFLLVKPHPYQESAAHLWPVHGAIPNAMWCTENLYALMCHDNVEFIVALSSSALSEAPFFLKAAHALIRPDGDDPAKLPASCSLYRRVNADIASIGIMSHILGAPPMSRGTTLPADSITNAIGARWGIADPVRPFGGIPVLEPGHQLSFASGGNGAAVLAEGWSEPESRGVWSDGPIATLRFRTKAPLGPGERLRLRLAGRLARAALGRVRSVQLRLPGCSEPIEVAGFRRKSSKLVQVEIDPENMPQRSFVEITFEVVNPASRATPGVWPDQQKFGVALSTLDFEVRRGAHAEGLDILRRVVRAWRRGADLLYLGGKVRKLCAARPS
ncbi:MAG: hypothetical protein ACLQIQ_00795 [Beijerinckiaceae bacterium]